MKKNLLVIFFIVCIFALTAISLKDESPAVPEHVLNMSNDTVLKGLLWTEYSGKLDRDKEITVSAGCQLHYFDEEKLASHGSSLDYRKYTDSKDNKDYVFSFMQNGKGIMLFIVRDEGKQAQLLNAGGYGRQFVQATDLIRKLSEKAKVEIYQYYISGKYVAFVTEGNQRHAIVFDTSDSDLDSRYIEIKSVSDLPKAEKFMKKYLDEIDYFTRQQKGEDNMLFGELETYDLFD